jgi:glycosyltransferase involved in cell wall biosynthesis
MKRVRLSLGIPVYNQAATIKETVESALAQTEPFDDILVVDNHSTDGTAERLLPYEGRLRVIRPPQHLQMVENWNFCASQMDGDWFSLLSGDDLIKPAFASALRKSAQAHPSAALVRTDWDVIDQHGAVRSIRRQMSVSRVTQPPSTWFEQLYGPKVCFAAFATRRDLWVAVGGFPTDFHLFQDWMFWLKLAPHGAFIRVPEALAQYRSHERPELERKRAGLRLLDEYRYSMVVLPDLPWAGYNIARKIKTVRRRRLIDLLNYLSQFRAILDEGDFRQLAELANSADMIQQYQRWLINSIPLNLFFADRLMHGLRQAVRRIVTSDNSGCRK